MLFHYTTSVLIFHLLHLIIFFAVPFQFRSCLYFIYFVFVISFSSVNQWFMLWSTDMALLTGSFAQGRS